MLMETRWGAWTFILKVTLPFPAKIVSEKAYERIRAFTRAQGFSPHGGGYMEITLPSSKKKPLPSAQVLKDAKGRT